ncbi:hypothetical protein A9K55_009138 [Cordyceps militaris]|uniref:Uncharacterized protein n=1 Tax=Cordyceps militaris TaxID=73501 RepID=A0A2H4SGB0_CORMI|nr:hypothetical protein A9K55_009138 [Cordyceps militaris]
MLDLPSLYFGAFVGVFAFTLVEICAQTRRIVQRARAWGWANGYLYMIWSEGLVNLVLAVITILHFNDRIPGTLAFYFGTVTMWALQTQVLSQIIANRVCLIMVSRQRATWMRWGLFALILGVNVGVYIIWIPAYLPNAGPGRKRLNDIFEKFEKSFFLVVDLGLNAFFLYLVRFRLIAGGLPKYWALFKMNLVLIVVSTAMDAALLGMLSLSDPYVYVALASRNMAIGNADSPYRYVQFAPLAYTIKLYIELVMTSLIAKVVSSEGAPGQVASISGYPSFQPPLPMGHADKYGSTKSIFGDKSIFEGASFAPPASKFDAQSVRSATLSYHTDIEGRYEVAGDEGYLEPVPETSIIKTVTTTVVSEDKNKQPVKSVAGSVRSHKSRLRAGAYDDWINEEPVPPIPERQQSVSTTRSKSRRMRHPLTSRFNQRQR